ncbi:hypothetical protein niasHS_006745 [Heterodera schachtii]|uniref:Cadherin domain-containing protein n=1 Tax=Heterodera schachtii TaxID=97005 RepID=A0ABD2JIL2_HETSC
MFLFLFICLPPSFSSSASSSLYSEQSLHVQLVEECPFGSSVLRLPSLPLSFSPWHLSPSAYSSLVSLNASSGDLFTSGRIDRESLPIDAKNEQILLEFVFVSRLAVTKRMASPSAPSLPLAQSFRLFRLTVEILDVNDNAPIFGTEQLNLSISESASPGSRFTLGKARDSDAGNNGTIGGCELMPLPEVPSSEDISEYFHAEKDPTGDLVLELNNKQMDREQTDYLRGRLRVWDAGAPQREAIVGLSIRLLDANDNAPRFEQTLYNLTFEQNERMASEKVKLGKVRATDLDEGENGRVKYEMNGESDGALEVDERSGELFIGRRRMAKNVCPPNGPPSECLFVVNAIDGGVPPLSAKATVLVKLAKEKEEGTKGTERSEQRRRKKQAKIRIKNFPAGQTFASLGSESPNGTVISVVTMENTDNEEEDGEKEQQQTQFVIRGTQQMFRLEQLRNGLALIRWNGTAQNAGGNGRHWTLEIGRKRSEDGREIGPTEKVQVFLRPSSSDQSDQLAFLPPPPLLPLLHIVRLPVDFPLGSLVLRLNSSSSSFSSHFQLVSSEWDHIFELHPVAGLLRLKMPFPQLGDGETGRNITVKVEEMARDQSAEQQQEKEEKLAQIEVQIEVSLGNGSRKGQKGEKRAKKGQREGGVGLAGSNSLSIPIPFWLFDVNNQQRPLIAGCAPTDSPCVLSLRLAEDFPLGVSLFSLFSLNASDSALRFSLRPFSSDFASLALFTIDAQLGIVSLRQSLDFERSSEHRFWVEVTDRETPPGRAKAILEVFVEDVNDEVPQFAPPAAVFLSLPLSLPASSVLLSVSATDSDFVDLRFGLRYELLENYGTFPRGMFQLAGDQLILVKSPASFGLKANDQFVFQIGAMDLANHSAPSPLIVNVRIVAAEAKVPLRKASLNLTMGQCLSEDDILKNVSAFVPRDGPRFVNLSLLHGDPSLLLFRSSPLSLCLRFSPSFPPKLPSHFLLADFGSVGWTLIELFPSIPPTDRPRLTFVDASPNITVVLSETAIGTPLHRFRVHLFGPRDEIRFKLEDDQLGILGLHPTEGLLWLARNERSKGRETEMAVVAQFGEEKRVVARQKFWLKIGGDDDQTERDLLRFPASLSISVPIDASLHPGDLLANLASLFPTSHRFKLSFNFHAQNLSSNWQSDEFVALFPNGEIRLLKQPPFGINIWQREVKVQQQEKRLYYSRTDKLKTDKWSTDKWSMIGERIAPVRLIIKNPLRSVDDSLSLHCPNPPQRFLWHNAPPGTFVGTLAERQNFSGGTERIKRIELLDHLDLFLVDELSGNIHIRTREKLIDRGGQLDIRYRIGEAGERENEKRRECEAKVELVDPFARKEEKRRENIIRREISQRIAGEKMRHDGMALAEKEGRNWHNGTQCQLEKAVMRDELGAAQKFENFATPSLIPWNGFSPF